MLIEEPIKLPDDLHLLCYACEKMPSTHLCRFKIGNLIVQVCLCPECMQMDTKRLLKDTVGIREVTDYPSANHLVFDELRFSTWAKKNGGRRE